MAKLDGVKLIDMNDGEVTKVEYAGVRYELTDERARIGDVIFNIKGHPGQLASSYYKVVEVDEYVRVEDEYGDHNGWKHKVQGEYFKVFRNVPTDEKVVKPGDKIRVVEAHVTAGRYEDGDVLTVIDLVKGPFYPAVLVKEHGQPLHYEEFEVISAEEAKQEEDTRRWKEIGREPGVYREGDIVNADDGDFYELSHRVCGYDALGHGKAWRLEGKSGWLGEDQFELAAPVDKRFDRAGMTVAKR